MVALEPQHAALSMVSLQLSFLSSESKFISALNSRIMFTRADSCSQPFWGRVVAASGAGPAPIAYRQLSVHNLLNAIHVCRSSEAKVAAEAIAARMRQEDGVNTAVQSFHQRLPSSQLCCGVLPQHVARWVYTPRKSKHDNVKLSNEALAILLGSKDVELSRVQP